MNMEKWLWPSSRKIIKNFTSILLWIYICFSTAALLPSKVSITDTKNAKGDGEQAAEEEGTKDWRKHISMQIEFHSEKKNEMKLNIF